jgi:hypothetical protein
MAILCCVAKNSLRGTVPIHCNAEYRYTRSTHLGCSFARQIVAIRRRLRFIISPQDRAETYSFDMGVMAARQYVMAVVLSLKTNIEEMEAGRLCN